MMDMFGRPATSTSPGPLARLHIRRQLRLQLDKHGSRKFTNVQINEIMSNVGDEVIDHAASEVGLTAPSAGGFIAWIAAHKDQIAAVVKLILAALGV